MRPRNCNTYATVTNGVAWQVARARLHCKMGMSRPFINHWTRSTRGRNTGRVGRGTKEALNLATLIELSQSTGYGNRKMLLSRRCAAVLLAVGFVTAAPLASAQNTPNDGIYRNLLERQQREAEFHVNLYDNRLPTP